MLRGRIRQLRRIRRIGPALFGQTLSASDRRVTRQTLWLGAIMAVQLLSGLAQVSISARILGPEGFGVLAVIISVTSLVHALASVPGGNAVTTFVTRSVAEGRPEEASRILRFTLAVSLGLSLVAYAIIAALIFTATSLLGIGESFVGAALLFGVVGILAATETPATAVLRLADRISLGLLVTLVGTLARVSLLAVAWLADGRLFDVVLAYVASAAISGAGLLAAAALSAPRAGITGLLRSLSVKVPSDVVVFQIGTFGKTALGALTEHIDSILVAQFAGVGNAGLYRGARQITDIARRPFRLLINGVQPEYSRQWYSGQGAALRRTSLGFTLLGVALAGVGFGVLAVFREPISRLILGAEFSGAASLLLIMIPGSFVVAGFATLSVLPDATGRIHPSLIAWIAAIAAFLITIFALAPKFGAEGAAWANTTYRIVWCIVLTPFIISILRQSCRNNDEDI